MRVSKAISLALVTLLIIPLIAPAAAGEWTDDGWLTNLIGPERMENGDEFGCHGFEGVDSMQDNWVIDECREYLLDHTNASRWGKAPVSFGFSESSLDNQTVSTLIESGFLIVGDMLEDTPVGLASFVRNGGSMEKNSANFQLLESAEEDTLVSVWWRARVDDIKVREDKDLISWLENQDVWFTTWGEWHLHGISGNSTNFSVDGSKVTIDSPKAERWSVPGTTSLQFEGGISAVHDSFGEIFPELSPDSRKLETGWRAIEGGILDTQSPGSSIILDLEEEPDSISLTPMSTFNDLHHGVTVVGHHTTNLFQWSSDFQKSILTFTWLVERPSEETINWSLPIIAISVLIAVPIIVKKVVQMDDLNHSDLQSQELNNMDLD